MLSRTGSQGGHQHFKVNVFTEAVAEAAAWFVIFIQIRNRELNLEGLMRGWDISMSDAPWQTEMTETAVLPSTSNRGHSSSAEQYLGTGGDGVSCGGDGQPDEFPYLISIQVMPEIDI